MRKNVGGVDKFIRVILGLVIIIVGYVYKSWWGALGLLPIAIAMLSWCPLYSIIGVCTIKGCTCKSEAEMSDRR